MKKVILLAIIALTTTSAQAKVLEINSERAVYISGPIGGNSFDIANKIEELSKTAEPVYLVINSPGGAVTPGYIIINAMNVAKVRGVEFICYVPQLSASMSFQVFANCDKRYALPGAYLLYHPVRISAALTLTPAFTRQLYIELRQIEKRMTAELLLALNVDKRSFDYNYLVETLWTAGQFMDHSPKFLTIVQDATGLEENYQQFELRQRSPFGLRQGYRFIYQAPDSLNLIRQPKGAL